MTLLSDLWNQLELGKIDFEAIVGRVGGSERGGLERDVLGKRIDCMKQTETEECFGSSLK